MSRYNRSEVDIDARFDDRRSHYSGGGRSRYDDRREIDVDFRRGSGPVPARERETVILKERQESDAGRLPAFLRDDYGQTDNAGAMVLRARDQEDIIYAPSRSSRRRRSPSPDKRERDEIIIRREERSESRPPAPRPVPRPAPRPREVSREREEIIIRRDERSESRGPPGRYRSTSREREEIIIRRDEIDGRDSYAPPRRSTTAPPPRDYEREREEIIIRRDEEDTRSRRGRGEREREEIIIRRNEDDTRSRRDDDMISHRSYRPPPPPARTEVDRSEIIIRRDQQDSSGRDSRRPRYEDNSLALARPISHERARGRSRSSASEDEIIIRRDQREGRNGNQSMQEIVIRKSSRSRSRSPSPVASIRAAPAPLPVPEPQIIYAPQIHQEVVTHHRHIDHGYEVRNPRRAPEPVYSRPPSPPSPPPPPAPVPQSVRSESEERIEIRRSETKNGRREDERITISRNERSRSRGPPPSRYHERDDFEVDYSSHRRPRWEEPIREPEPIPEPPTIGPRYGARRDPRDGLWTEITKDLVVKEAIKEMGYEYEETDGFYYIFKFMDYADVARLVGLSEDIKKDRYRRIKEIQWESRASPRPAIEPASPRAPLAIEAPPLRGHHRDGDWNREDERYVEREIVYRGGRPPPPVDWRR